MSTPPAAANPSTSTTPKRLFTDKDEISLLQSLLHNTSNPSFERNYTKEQIKNKINRLKQKYRHQDKPSSKKPHDLEVYELSAQIWGPKEEAVLKRRGIINWRDYPNVVKHAKETFPGGEECYMEGIEGLEEDDLKRLEQKWVQATREMSEIQTRKSQLMNRSLQRQ
ncbi:hypothetical protein CASFOL_035040 [Castilleja foliolosa]|uniref:Glabrous enhancer-binding protein-like DBD domain-containing protein n=1 Tax=Castilleja foliolosa TaxID=1961234 RepID=A0ABD3BRI0_9LAMI